MNTSVFYRAACAAFGSILLAGMAQAAPITVDITASADASVTSGNTGLNDQSSNYWRGQNTDTAYVRFNLPVDFGTALSGTTLLIHPIVAANQWMGIFGVPYANDTWTETGINYSNQPAHTLTDGSADCVGLFLGSAAANGSGYQTAAGIDSGTSYYAAEFLTFLNGAPGAGKTSVSFAFNDAYNGGTLGHFSTRESATPPILHLTYERFPNRPACRSWRWVVWR